MGGSGSSSWKGFPTAGLLHDGQPPEQLTLEEQLTPQLRGPQGISRSSTQPKDLA